MTPAESQAVVQAAPLNLLNGVTVDDVVGLDGDRVILTVTLANLGTFTFEVQVPFGPLPLTPPELLAVAVRAQDRISDTLAIYEVQPGRGFNEAGRGGLNSVQGFRAADGWV